MVRLSELNFLVIKHEETLRTEFISRTPKRIVGDVKSVRKVF